LPMFFGTSMRGMVEQVGLRPDRYTATVRCS
jgi:hypothetical protein